jgi:hypothetical protein
VDLQGKIDFKKTEENETPGLFHLSFPLKNEATSKSKVHLA